MFTTTRSHHISTAVLLIELITLSVVLDVETQESSTINVVGLFEHVGGDSALSPERDDRDAQEILQKAVNYINHRARSDPNIFDQFSFDSSVRNGFHLSQEVCEVISNIGAVALLGVRSKSLRSHMHTISSNTHVPYLELMPSSNYSREMVLNMHPPLDDMVNMTIQLVTKWRWNKTLFIYEEDDALVAYMKLLALQSTDRIEIQSKQMSKSQEYSETLNYLKAYLKGTQYKHVIVSCRLQTVKPFLDKAVEMQMLTDDYHYHFTSLDLHVLSLSHYSYGGANITWCQLVNRTGSEKWQKSLAIQKYEEDLNYQGLSNPPEYYFTTYNALIVDSMITLAQAIGEMKLKDISFNQRPVPCENGLWEQGFYLEKHLKKVVEHDGLTGHIQFEPTGQINKRVNYTLHLMTLRENGIIEQAGDYVPTREVRLYPLPMENVRLVDDDDYLDRVLNISSVISAPFFMEKSATPGKELTGNDRYEGYVVDMMEKIAEITGITYRFVKAKDGQFGKRYPNGSFDGMVGEVMRREADMALSSLTINSDRQGVIDFTKPFMSFGIAILYKKPEKEPPHLLTFIEPIKYEVWGTIIVSVVIVSFSMYLFSRFSPSEWENPFPCNESYQFMENQFNLSNSFWFTVGSIMQQGCDVMPKAPSTRLLAIAWWLFTLIIISSYTANLAAFLTISTTSRTFKNAEELANQAEVQYGCKKNGNTRDFFAQSDIGVYKKMWEYMSTSPGVMVDAVKGKEKVKNENYAYIMESPSLQYETTKDCSLTQVGPLLNSLSYGIGVSKKSPLRDVLSSAILKLLEDQVLLQLYNKWWKVNDNKCANADSGGDDPKLKLKNLEGIFVFLMGGLAVACFFLCIEILIFTLYRSKEENQSLCKVIGIWMRNSIRGRFPSLENLDNSPPASIQSSMKNRSRDSERKESMEPWSNGLEPGLSSSAAMRYPNQYG